MAPPAPSKRARPPTTPTPRCPNTTATPTSCITTTPQRSRHRQATHPTRRTTPQHTFTCTTGTITTTTNPYHHTHQRHGTTHSQHTLTNTTTPSSTTYRPHCTGSQHLGHRVAACIRGGRLTRTNSTRAYKEHPTTTSSPPTRTPCQQAPSITRLPLPTDHGPNRMPRQPPPTRTSTPQPARDCKNRTARTRNTHTTWQDAQTPVQHSTEPYPPQFQQYRPHTIPLCPPPPPKTRPHKHHVETPTSPRHTQPLPTHTTTSPASRGHQEKPHHQTPHATMTTTPPNPHHPPHSIPHHQPPHWPSPTPYRTPQRYGSTSGGSETRRCYASTPPAPPNASRHPTLVQATTLGEGVRDFLFDAFLHVARHVHPPLATRDGESPPPTGTESGCPASTGGDTLSDTPCRGGWTPRAASATTSPTWPIAHPVPLPATPRRGKGRHGSTG